MWAFPPLALYNVRAISGAPRDILVATSSNVEAEAEAGSGKREMNGSGSGSGKHEMNRSRSGSWSSKEILKAEAEAIKIYRFHRFHYSGF